MEQERFPSILNDVMGPVMRGPSSSHTAASWRIAHAALQLLNDTLESALVEMDRRGTWAANYREQGTAMGMDGGLLGIELTDERIIRHEQIAGEQNIAIEYRISDFETDHTNTVRLTLKGSSGRKVQLIAVSTGGGMFEIRNYNGYQVKIRGDSYHLFIIAGATYHSGILASIRELQGDRGWKRIIPATEADLIQLNSSGPFPGDLSARLAGLPGVQEVLPVDPVLPVLSGMGEGVPFRSLDSMLEFAGSDPYSLGRLGLMYESGRSGLPEEELTGKMKEIIRIIESGIDKGLEGTEFRNRILHRQSHLVDEAARDGKIFSDPLVNRIIAYSTALMEAKSAMEVIVAVPTAGACGVFGGTVRAFCDSNELQEEQKILAYFAGGLIGVFFALGPGFSAEEHGCQVETGAASCMAAAALVELSGGDFRQALGAASMALQNMIGLVCDPVADRVEVPCLGKNVTGGMNALAASTMALSGFDPVIPLDQVITTVQRVGRALPSALCNTGKGGLAVTPRARELKEFLSRLQKEPPDALKDR
jgi:L-serine dehydratase